MILMSILITHFHIWSLRAHYIFPYVIIYLVVAQKWKFLFCRVKEKKNFKFSLNFQIPKLSTVSVRSLYKQKKETSTEKKKKKLTHQVPKIVISREEGVERRWSINNLKIWKIGETHLENRFKNCVLHDGGFRGGGNPDSRSGILQLRSLRCRGSATSNTTALQHPWSLKPSPVFITASPYRSTVYLGAILINWRLLRGLPGCTRRSHD